MGADGDTGMRGLEVSAGLTPEDIAAAIAFTEDSKHSHEVWLAYYEDGGEVDSVGAGDAQHQKECIAEYEHILAVLSTVIPA